jgi:hypothetical protein
VRSSQRPFASAASARMLPVLCLVFLLPSCAHAPLADVDLTGRWEGTMDWTVSDGRSIVASTPVHFDLSLVDRAGHITGFGTVVPSNMPDRRRDLDVSGTVEGGRFELRLMYVNRSGGGLVFRGTVVRGERLRGAVEGTDVVDNRRRPPHWRHLTVVRAEPSPG